MEQAQMNPGDIMMMVMAPVMVACVIIAVVLVMAFWKMFTKAGKPGWACLIPIYNIVVLCQIAGRPGWWTVLLMIPLVGLIFTIILMIDLAKSFGKGAGFGIGLALLGIIFYPILGFGSAQYVGPSAAQGGGAADPS